MTFFFLYNPKYYDPGAVIRDHYDALPEKRKDEEKEIPKTKELKEKHETFAKIAKKANAIRQKVIETKANEAARLELIAKYQDVLKKEAEIARLLLMMEEEELAAILLLLEK
jgi:hypothetical protein